MLNLSHKINVKKTTYINVFCFVYSGGGLLKLHDDIQTCGYEDVQVMWEMLHRTESELTSNNTRKRNKPKSFWKVFIWHNNTCSSPFSIDHA